MNIENVDFQRETEITDRYLKSDCNNTYGLGHDQKCLKWILEAHLICLFGLSFGDTDKIWWETIGHVLKNGTCKVILFGHNPEEQFNGNQGPAKKAAKEKMKRSFLSKTNLDEAFRENAQKNIYIAHNAKMFKFNLIATESSE